MNTKSVLQQIAFILLFIAVIVTMIIGLWPEDIIVQDPGVLAKGAPKVTRLRQEPIHRDGFELLPIAHFSFTGRILIRRNYHYVFGLNMFSFDKAAAVSPVDILIGWNEMSDETTLKEFRFYIDGRESSWKPEDINDRPKLTKLVTSNSALVHIIPGNPEVQRILDNIHVGHIIKCDGNVVKVSSTSTAFSWGTSKLEESIADRDYIVMMNEMKIVK